MSRIKSGLKDSFPNNKDAVAVETAGEFLSDGRIVEPISDGATGSLKLLVSNGQTCTLASRVDCEGRTYVPLHLDPLALRAIRFPDKASEYGSTQKLFSALQEQFIICGFTEEVAVLTPYFLFGTWFSDYLPAAPCLLITGPRTEASFFFQLLDCLVRHPLSLVEFNSTGLADVMRAHPTLLINQELYKAATLKMLLATNHHNAYVPQRRGLVDFYCAKAVYMGIAAAEDCFDYPALHVALTPLRRKLPVLDLKARHLIASRFQPMLLGYRLRNINGVRESELDFPEFAPPVRILARVLGSCLIDSLDLQIGLLNLLREHQEEMRAGTWDSLRCVLIEALLAHCHSERIDEPVYVGQCTEDAKLILIGRGSPKTLKPKTVGRLLRTSLKLKLKRDGKGWAIRLTAAVRRKVHELARDFDVAASQLGGAKCGLCSEVFAAAGGGAKNGATPRNGQ